MYLIELYPRVDFQLTLGEENATSTTTMNKTWTKHFSQEILLVHPFTDGGGHSM